MAAATCTNCQIHAESTFKVEGMDCREEVALIERRFRHLAGVEAFSADLIGQRLHVKYDAARLTTSAIAGAVADAGMRAWLEHEEPIVEGEAAARRRSVLIGASAALFAAGAAAAWVGGPALWSRLAYAGAMAAAMPLTLPRAWRAARARTLDINVLMLVACAGAVALGQWAEAAAVVLLFGIAQTLEARTIERARHAVRALMDLTPADALVRTESGEQRVDADLIAPGTVIIVKPGEKIPLDGEVIAGESSVNQAPVTGES